MRERYDVIELFRDRLPVQGFKWRSRGDVETAPADMATRHLFMCLVMIWNHTMPYGSEIIRSGQWEHHMYNFGPYYTREYMATAVRAIAAELFKRDDLEDCWLQTLNKMSEYLKDRGARLICE